MNQYNFTGKGTLILKAEISGKYGNQTYEKGEPIAVFSDVFININFSNTEKIATKGAANLAANSETALSMLMVQNIKTTESLQSLIYGVQTNQINLKTRREIGTSSDGVLYLGIASNEVISGSIFIYDSNRQRVTTFTLDDTNNSILGLANGTYSIFYSVQKEALKTYKLQTNHMPLLSAEIQVVGNINGSNGEVVMHLKRLKLLTRPSFNFDDPNPFVGELVFAIMDPNDINEVVYYG